MGRPSERISIIEIDPETGYVDRQQVLQVVMDFIGTLFAVGGKLQIGADRVVVGEVQVGESVQPIAETHGLVFRYQSFSPARRVNEQQAPLDEAQESATAGDEDHDEPAAEVEFDAEGDAEIAVADRDDLMTPEEIAELQAFERVGAAG